MSAIREGKGYAALPVSAGLVGIRPDERIIGAVVAVAARADAAMGADRIGGPARAEIEAVARDRCRGGGG